MTKTMTKTAIRLTFNSQFSILNYEPSSPEAARHGSIEAAILAPQGTEETLVDEFVEVFEGEMLGALAHLLHL
jgi:hypothetical protein